jgi:deoxyribonuclease IV
MIMKQLLFGTAGIPWSAKGQGTSEGIKEVKRLGLGAMELEFVRSVNIKKDKAPMVKQTAKEQDVVLTCHGQYFVNLNSQDTKVIDASIKRIKQASTIASICGAWSICFHMAYYSNTPHDKVNIQVKKILKPIIKELKNEGHDLFIRPETGGKINQFADSYDLIKLAEEEPSIQPCFDFAHQYSRTLGKWNNKEEFRRLFSAIEKNLGRKGLDNMHIHMEGIEFTDKGEKNHVNLSECPFKYKDLLKVMKEFNSKGVVTCESPNIEQDALKLQKVYKGL